MFDYVVIGAGSAGCAVAGRLSENPNNRVLLLEAGPADKHPMIHMPGGAAEVLKSNSLNWQYYSAPQKNLNNRRLYVPRGKMLGGSSGLNGMVYIRGHQSDYDQWRDLGNAGWGFSDVLPFFKKAEDNMRGSNAFHGAGGGLSVENAPSTNELFDMFIQAGTELGYPLTDDFNGAQQEGFARYQATIRKGRRCSSAVAFLTPDVRKRENLKIVTGATVSKVLLDGKQVTGVEYYLGKKNRQVAKVTKEAIVCAGAIKAPQLLQLSGIGNREDLEKIGVPVLHELPGVGRNLQEHLDLVINRECTKPITLNGPATKIHLQIKTAIDYFLFNRGIATCNNIEAGSFMKTQPHLDRPDIQLHFVPVMMYGLIDPIPTQDGITLHACNLRPKSRGHIIAQNTNPGDQPLIDFNFMDHEDDWGVMLRAFYISQEILEAKAWKDYLGAPVRPSKKLSEDEQVREFIRQYSDSVYHPVGTCKMGNDEEAVVDHQLRVRGVSGLRVADASIMPTLIGGNTNAPCMMIGEKCAHMIMHDL